jgi:hypothetical protein
MFTQFLRVNFPEALTFAPFVSRQSGTGLRKIFFYFLCHFWRAKVTKTLLFFCMKFLSDKVEAVGKNRSWSNRKARKGL